MKSFEEEVKPATKPILLGFNSKKSDNDTNKINEINFFSKTSKENLRLYLKSICIFWLIIFQLQKNVD